MADYYPLLERAVASLPESTPETRRAIYERARKALLNQLRNVQPPVPESYINRENQALNLSIAQLEAALARAADAPPAGRPVAPRSTRPAPAAPQPGGFRPPPQPDLKSQAESKSSAPPVPGASRDAQDARPDGERGAEPEVALSPEDERRDGEQGEGQEARRPVAIAPPKSPPHPMKRVAILGAILLSATVAVAALAIRLKDNPQDYARSRTPVSQEEQEPEAPAGKLIDRVGSDQTGRAGAPTPPPRPAQAPAPAPEPALPVAQRAAILIEAPEDPQRVKTFVGTSIWRFDANGGQPALVADINLPDAKLAVSMRMMRNTDPKLPASHTIEFRFTPAPGPDPIGIAEIETPQMRMEDSANGAPLAGVPAPILPNFFLVGLSNGDKLASRNMDLMRDRGWFDVPMVLSNGRIAKLTFEKGPSGDRALAQAVQAWEKR